MALVVFQMGASTNTKLKTTPTDIENRINMLEERLKQKVGNDNASIQDRTENLNQSNPLQKSAYEAIIKFSEKAIYALLWISGGTTIALLVFLEKIYNTNNRYILNRITDTILLAFISTVLAGICYGVAYFAQLNFTIDDDKKGNFWNRLSLIIVISCNLLLLSAGITLFCSLR